MARSALAFSTNEQRSKPLDAARLVNLFPEQPPLGSRAPGLTIGQGAPIKAVLYGTPGLKSFVTAGSGKVRAFREALGYLWALVDGALYRIDSAGTATLCTGAAIDQAGTAMITDNGIQVVVLSNGTSYVAGTSVAKCAFTITAGSYNAGTNRITSITVNGVTITSGAVNWSGSHENFAALLAADINGYSSAPDYTAEANGATVIISALAGTGTGPNGFAVVVNVGGDVTVVNPGTMSGGSSGATVVTEITDTAYQDASSVDFMDGYIIWSKKDSRQFFISALYDATAIDATDFASAESTAADIVRVLVDHRELWVFKKKGIEIWANTGAIHFPFERISGAVLERGCAAGLSPAKSDNSVFWLGDDLVVYQARGYQPERISTHGIEEIIRAGSVSDGVADAFGMTYTQNGHQFYVLTFPGMDRTFVYDSTDPSWHERQSGTSLVPAKWDVNCIASAFDSKLFAGTMAGKISELDLDTYTDESDTIRRVVVTPPLFNDGKRAIMPFIEVECELGVGLNTGQGSAPVCMLRWSDDGGATWSNERTASLGATGVRNRRAMFRRLGIFRQRMFELSISDPVRVAAYGVRFEGMGMSA